MGGRSERSRNSETKEDRSQIVRKRAGRESEEDGELRKYT
jgi:hypothetical protein